MNQRPTTIRIGRALWERVLDHHLADGKRVEALSYVWARCERTMGGLVVLIPSKAPYFAFQADCYERQSSGNVRLRPDVLNGMLVEFAGSDYNCVVNIHDHWFAQHGVFSAVDDEDDARFDTYLHERFEPMLALHPGIGPCRPIFNLSLVVGQQTTGARMTGGHRLNSRVDRMTIADEKWREVSLSHAVRSNARPMQADVHLRHQSFITAQVQNSLAHLTVGIVGCGGLGSILAETLGRLGIRRFRLIDDDRLGTSNLNRWQGARPGDVGRRKTELLGKMLRDQFPGCDVRTVSRPMSHGNSTAAIAGSDVVFGCVDNDAARWHLNHVALQFMVPYFDAGVSVVAGPPVELSTRYFAVLPEATGCVDCKGIDLLDREEVLAAFISPEIAAERRNAGYVLDRPETPAASAYMLNQRAASLLAMEFCNFMTGWRSTATVAYENWNAWAAKRLDRDTFPEHPADGCPVCGIRTGAGYSLALPRPTGGIRIDPLDFSRARASETAVSNRRSAKKK